MRGPLCPKCILPQEVGGMCASCAREAAQAEEMRGRRKALEEAPTEPCGPVRRWRVRTSYARDWEDLSDGERAEIRSQYPFIADQYLAIAKWEAEVLP